MTPTQRALAGALVLMLGAGAASAQQNVPGAELAQVLVSRDQLEDLATRLEQTANSGSFTTEVRQRARQQAQLARERLANGDFQPGDRIYLQVEAETALTDTFAVRSGRELVLPGIGEVPLQGVLRVELTDHLTRIISQFVRNPKVHAQGLIRVAVMGAVGAQGFYTVPVDVPVNAVLMTAGGPAGTADLDKIRIERANEILYDGPFLQQAITQGRTLDAMSIQAGDRFIVPTLKVRNPLAVVTTVQILLTIPITIYTLTRIF